MFKANKNTLTNNIHTFFISGRKHKFIRKKIRTDRKSFCISIIGLQLWNYYYMINILKNIITFKKDVEDSIFIFSNIIIIYCM